MFQKSGFTTLNRWFIMTSETRRLTKIDCGIAIQRCGEDATINPLHRFHHYSQSTKMGKSDEDVVQEFNELVNMSASELEKWLKVSERRILMCFCCD